MTIDNIIKTHFGDYHSSQNDVKQNKNVVYGEHASYEVCPVTKEIQDNEHRGYSKLPQYIYNFNRFNNSYEE